MFPLNAGRQDSSKPWTTGVNGGSSVASTAAAPRGFGAAVGEVDEETKKNHNIINIVREGQISLLVSERHHDSLSQNKSNIYNILKKCSCDVQVFP